MKTPITYYGGKQTMLKYILPLIPEYRVYTEAFCGGAAVLFAKERSKCEVKNDINSDIVNFYFVARDHYYELEQMVSKTLHSRDIHAHAFHIRKYPDFFTSIERAWAFWALGKLAYSSLIDGPFGYDYNGAAARKIFNAKEQFTDTICKRLDCVTIENMDALEVIRRYDSRDTFHFIDPPYFNSDCGHFERLEYNEASFRELIDVLVSIEGKFMLTMYPLDVLAEVAKANSWEIVSVERAINTSMTICTNGLKRKRKIEWIVKNY